MNPSLLPLRASLAAAFMGVLGEMSAAEPSGAQALEVFFELGLPAPTAATWVRAALAEGNAGAVLPSGRNTPYTGNAWLLKEAGGKVELLLVDGRTVLGKKAAAAKRAQEDAEEMEDGEIAPSDVVQFRPADLEADLKTFAEALKTPDESRSRRSEGDPFAGRRRVAGGSLLFLLQLQRLGRADFVRSELPKVLALVPSPEAALDGAVTLLAEGQAANLMQAWSAKREAAAYAAGLEALAAKFPRGWSTRDAAALLARRLREPKLAALANDADAKVAADFLLKLTTAQVRALPGDRNWFLSERSRFAARMADAKPAKKDDAVTRFFADKRGAAVALAKLLGDERMAAGRYTSERDRYRSSYSREQKTRQQIVEEQYAALARPSELGEIARAMLLPLLPQSITGYETPENRRDEAILAWTRQAAAKSDEVLALDYLRAADNTYDEAFKAALTFLTEKGSPETLARLKEVFLDPGVWNSSSLDEMAPLVASYVQRAPEEAAFAEKVKAAAKAGLAADASERQRYNSGTGMEEIKKQQDARLAGQLRQLDAIFKPGGSVAEQLEEIAGLDEMEALAALQPLTGMLAKKPLAEYEGPAFLAAARAKSPQVKAQLIQLTMAGARGDGKTDAAAPAPTDPAAVAAMIQLLADETPVTIQWAPMNSASVSANTASAIVWLHGDPASQARWQELTRSAPGLSARLMRRHAEALANHAPEPPIPDAEKVPAERRAAIVAELGAQPAEKVLEALAAKSPDEQLATIAHLQEAPEWPASLVAAHFSVSKVAGEQADLPEAAKWQGRKLDEAFIGEVHSAALHAAQRGKFINLTIAVAGPLAGVEISFTLMAQTYSPDTLKRWAVPGLAGKEQPFALSGAWLQSDDADGQTPRNFLFPVWKDDAATRAWRAEHGQPKPADAAQTDKAARPEVSFNPGPFEEKLRACLALKKDTRGSVQIMIFTAGIGAGQEGNE